MPTLDETRQLLAAIKPNWHQNSTDREFRTLAGIINAVVDEAAAAFRTAASSQLQGQRVVESSAVTFRALLRRTARKPDGTPWTGGYSGTLMVKSLRVGKRRVKIIFVQYLSDHPLRAMYLPIELFQNVLNEIGAQSLDLTRGYMPALPSGNEFAARILGLDRFSNTKSFPFPGMAHFYCDLDRIERTRGDEEPFRILMRPRPDGSFELAVEEFTEEEKQARLQEIDRKRPYAEGRFRGAAAIKAYAATLLPRLFEVEAQLREERAAVEAKQQAERLARRKGTTGRFDTREELCEFVWAEYLGTDRSMIEIARAARVSDGVVRKIIDKPEGKPPKEEHDRLVEQRAARRKEQA